MNVSIIALPPPNSCLFVPISVVQSLHCFR